MGILDGGVRSLFGAAMGAFYLDATLTRVTNNVDGAGNVTESTTTTAVKAQYDEITEAMRAEADYSDEDVAILILQAAVGTKPSSDDRITIGADTWAIKAPITSDPAQSYWLVRGQRA